MKSSKSLLPASIGAEDKRREEAIATMSPALRKEYDEIMDEMQKHSAKNILYFHRLGVRASRIQQNPENKYGDAALPKLAAATSNNVSDLYRSLEFSQLYDLDELKEILDKSKSNNTILHWGHFVELIPIDDAQQRGILLDATITNKLSIRGLRDAIDHIKRGGKVSSGFTAPSTVRGNIKQVQGMSIRLIEKLDENFERSVFGPIGDLEDQQIDDSMLEIITEGEDAVQKLADIADRRARDLERLKGEITEILKKNKAKAAKEKDEEPAPKEKKETSKEEPAKKQRRPTPV